MPNKLKKKLKISPTEKKKHDKVYTVDLYAIVLGVIFVILLYFFLPKTTSLYIWIAVVISLAATILIAGTFTLNKDPEEDRLLFSNLFAVSILLFIGIISLLTLDASTVCSITASNTININTCNIFVKRTGLEYSDWLVMFTIFIFIALAMRLQHKYNKEKVFSCSKFISYLSLTFIIALQIIITLNMTGVLPVVIQ